MKLRVRQISKGEARHYPRVLVIVEEGTIGMGAGVGAYYEPALLEVFDEVSEQWEVVPITGVTQ